MPRASPRVTNSQLLPLIAWRTARMSLRRPHVRGTQPGAQGRVDLDRRRRPLLLLRHVAGHGGTLTDPTQRPLGDDYVNYWSGAFLAWHGRVADVYNLRVYHAFQQSIVGDL